MRTRRMSLHATILLFSFLLLPLYLGAQALRVWTDVEDQKISAIFSRLEDDTVWLVMDNRTVAIKLERLSPADQRYALLTHLSPLHRGASARLKQVVAKSENAPLLVEHQEDIVTMARYLDLLIEPVSSRLPDSGGFSTTSPYEERLLSGMAYFYSDFLRGFVNGDHFNRRPERRPTSLANTLAHFEKALDLFRSIHEQRDFLREVEGTQVAIKVSPPPDALPERPYHYLAFIPKGYLSSKEAWPVIFFLPGAGRFGQSIDTLIGSGFTSHLSKNPNYRMIVITIHENGDYYDPVYLDHILEDVLRRFRVDEDRLITVGSSAGGAGVWRWAVHRPDTFAALVPVCGVIPLEEIRVLKGIPVWMFTNEFDRPAYVYAQMLAESILKEEGSAVRSTIIEGAQGHNAWDATVETPELHRWILAQRRPAGRQAPPGAFDGLDFINQLTEPQVSSIRPTRYLSLDIESAVVSKPRSIEAQHERRYGLAHDNALNQAFGILYPYANRQLNLKINAPITGFFRPDSPGKYRFGLDAGTLQRSNIDEPFRLLNLPTFKSYRAYYLSPRSDPEPELIRLRQMARDAGYTLTGEDRVIYRQPLFWQRFFYELHVGIH